MHSLPGAGKKRPPDAGSQNKQQRDGSDDVHKTQHQSSRSETRTEKFHHRQTRGQQQEQVAEDQRQKQSQRESGEQERMRTGLAQLQAEKPTEGPCVTGGRRSEIGRRRGQTDVLRRRRTISAGRRIHA